MPDQHKPDHFLIDLAVVLKAPNGTAAKHLADELRDLLGEEPSVRLVRVCHIDPTDEDGTLPSPFPHHPASDWPYRDSVEDICRREMSDAMADQLSEEIRTVGP